MRSSPFTAVYDACVLYQAPLRDLLMWLGLSGCCRAHWSARIHDEWKRSLLRSRPDLTAAQLDRTSDLMDRAIPDALVTGYEALVDGLVLPDPDDRHVLAAAIRCHASVIVTFNEKDFPAAVVAAAQRQRRQLQNPPMDVSRYLDILLRQGLTQTVNGLAAFRHVL